MCLTNATTGIETPLCMGDVPILAQLKLRFAWAMFYFGQIETPLCVGNVPILAQLKLRFTWAMFLFWPN